MERPGREARSSILPATKKPTHIEIRRPPPVRRWIEAKSHSGTKNQSQKDILFVNFTIYPPLETSHPKSKRHKCGS